VAVAFFRPCVFSRREKVPYLGKRGEIAAVNRIHGLFELRSIEGVREQVAVVDHVDPRLAVIQNPSCKGVLDHLPRCHRTENHAALLQVVFDRLPGEFKRVFEPLLPTDVRAAIHEQVSRENTPSAGLRLVAFTWVQVFNLHMNHPGPGLPAG
jgi:hypothetical protein